MFEVKTQDRPVADAGGLLLPAGAPGQHGCRIGLQEEAGAPHQWQGKRPLEVLACKAQQARFHAYACHLRCGPA